LGTWLLIFQTSGTLFSDEPRHQQSEAQLADTQKSLQILHQGWHERPETQKTKAQNG
jgi:hypothetical protein